jgi:hypothetical protein
MTTYTQWRFCWLPEGKLQGSRVFCSTPPVAFDHDDIHRYVISALVKMSKTQVVAPEIKKENYFLYADKNGLTLKALPCDEKDMEAKLPGTKSEGFFLLRQLGEGAEGKIWLACNNSKRRCALKIYGILKAGDAERYQKVSKEEVEVWGKVFGLDIFRLETLAGGPALVMPELKLLKVDAMMPEHVTAVKSAVDAYAQHYTAEDFKWSHVGFCEIGDQLKAVLFDTKPKEHTPEQKQAGIVATTKEAMLKVLFP